MLGAVDEWYQYKILDPGGTDYFDFNDIIMNQLGASVAMILLFSAGIDSKKFFRSKWYFSPALISFFLICILIFFLSHFSLLHVYSTAQSTNTLFVLSKNPESFPFWRQLKDSEIIYHVLTPAEGIIIFMLLLIMMMWFDHMIIKK
jgi:hypothetical protein